MNKKQNTTRRDFLKASAAAGTAVAAPYVITSNALGQDDVPPASDRIVMGGIGIGNMGRGDQGSFLGRKDVQYVAVSDVRSGAREEAKKKVDDQIQQHGLSSLQRLPRIVGTHGHRCGTCCHSRSLARDHGDRSLSQRKRCVLPKARNTYAPRRSA